MGRRQVLIPPPRPARRPTQRAELDEDRVLLYREDVLRLRRFREILDEVGGLLAVHDRIALEARLRADRPAPDRVEHWLRAAVNELTARGAA